MCYKYCKALGSVPLLCFFIKNCGWEHCLLYQKLLGLAAKSGPKHFQNELAVIDPVAQQDPILLSLAQPDPKHFKRGWVWLPNQTRRSWVWLGSWTQYLWVWMCRHIQGYYYLYYKYFKFY